MTAGKLTGLVAWALLLAPAAAPAAVPGGTEPAASAPGAPPAVEEAPRPARARTEIFDEKPYKLYEQGERVDPFTLGKAAVERHGDGQDEGNGSAARTAEIQQAQQRYAQAEAKLTAGSQDRFASCLADCQAELPVLKANISSIEKNLATHPEWAKDLESYKLLAERFRRLETTAARLKARQEVEAEFQGLNVAVQGVIWSDRSPVAVVNGQVLSEGSVLILGQGAGKALQVTRVRRDSVMFIYRGVEVTARLKRGGQ